MTGSERSVAIVGAGPAGLVAAHFLKARGFAPVLFDRLPGRGGRQSQLMHLLAIRLARLARAEPRPAQAPALARALLFGPLIATSFRLQGSDALVGAAAAVAAEAARFPPLLHPGGARPARQAGPRPSRMTASRSMSARMEQVSVRC